MIRSQVFRIKFSVCVKVDRIFAAHELNSDDALRFFGIGSSHWTAESALIVGNIVNQWTPLIPQRKCIVATAISMTVNMIAPYDMH